MGKWVVGLVLALCPVPGAVDEASAGFPPPVIDEVLWMGDSIAYDLAPGVETALTEAGLDVSTFAFPGISLTGGDWLIGDERWIEARIPLALYLSEADVVVWQLSRFDSPVPADVNLLAHMSFAQMALKGPDRARVHHGAPGSAVASRERRAPALG